ASADALEIDEAPDQVLERIDVERIEVVGREKTRQIAKPWYRRGALRQQREQPLHHGALQVGEATGHADCAPEFRQPLLRPVASALGQPVGEHHRIDGTSGCAGDAPDLDTVIRKELVEYAPGESSMRAATLQRQVEALAPFPGLRKQLVQSRCK